MTTLVAVGCTECGWRGRYRSQPMADYAFRRHSCQKTRRERAATARGRARDAAVDRTPKPCRHRYANHQHGQYVTAKLDGCRCWPCTDAKSAYNAERGRAQAYGTWSPFVPTAPAVAHLRELSRAGMGWKRVAAAAGVPSSSVYPLLYGRPDRNGGAPRTKARRALVDAILAVPMPTLDDLGAAVIVDGTGTRRRLQALIVAGWSVQLLAARTDVDRQALDRALAQRPVQAKTARAVTALYDDLWDKLPPETTTGEKISAARSRRRAAAQAWAPALAWDDDTIDDPDTLPAHLIAADTHGIDEVSIDRAMTGHSPRLARAERWIAVEQLAAQGLSDRAIAARVGVSEHTVWRDRRDLGIASRWAAA